MNSILLALVNQICHMLSNNSHHHKHSCNSTLGSCVVDIKKCQDTDTDIPITNICNICNIGNINIGLANISPAARIEPSSPRHIQVVTATDLVMSPLFRYNASPLIASLIFRTLFCLLFLVTELLQAVTNTCATEEETLAGFSPRRVAERGVSTSYSFFVTG